jgi:hypothetical protein
MKTFEQWKYITVPAVFLVAVFLRFISLDADPPSTVGLHFLSDEGWWVHNARNKYLFDKWIQDEFNQSLLAAPPFCIATYGIYSLFGVNYGSSRLIPVISGLLTILLFSGILYARAPPSTAALATLLFGCNFAFATMNRTAYVDSTALMFLILSWWLIDRLPHRVWAVFLSGMSFALAILTKSYLLSVLVPVTAVILFRLHKNKVDFSRNSVLLNSILFSGGVFAVWMLWRKYLYIPFFDDYQLMYSLWQDGNFPKSVQEALRNIPSFFIGQHGTRMIPARFFGLNATLLILSGLRVHQLLISESTSLKALWRKMPDLDRECIIFLTVLSLQIAPLTAKPFRRYLLLYIPLVILASRCILNSEIKTPQNRIPSKMRLVHYIVPLAVTGILVPPYLVRLVPNFQSKTLAYIISVLLVCVLTALCIRISSSLKQFLKIPLPLAILVFIVIDGGLYVQNFMTRSYSMRDTSRRLGEMYFTSGSKILGGVAHSLCLENNGRPIAIWGREEAPRVLNQDPIRRFSPDYVIILTKLDGLEWGREFRYDRYTLPENHLETLHLLPDGNRFRVEAELYRAPVSETHAQSDSLLLVDGRRILGTQNTATR